jgi:FAD/FMN-containing dehydrogenase
VEWDSILRVSAYQPVTVATVTKDERMTGNSSTATGSLDSAALDSLANGVRGRIIRPRDPDYETARQVWNGRIDRRPGAILRAADARDVSAAVRLAHERDWTLAVRGGSHNVAGFGTVDGGLLIDLADISDVDIDPAARTVRVGGGAHWGPVDAATADHGQATVGGQISTTGVGGLTVGGGVGWLMREHGLTVDNLISAEVILADGTIVRTDAQTEPDLFWAIRGGGSNYGIVTEFELRTHPIGPVLSGILLYPLSQVRAAVRFLREYVYEISEQVTAMVLVIPAANANFVPEDLRGKPMVGLSICYSGDPARSETEAARLRAFAKPSIDTLRLMPYPMLQQLFDRGSPAGDRNLWRSPFLAGLGDEAIDAIAHIVENAPSPSCQILITHMEGAVARLADDATPFWYRRAPYYLEVIAKWYDPSDDERHVAWADAAWDALKPVSAGAAYINFLDETPSSEVRAAYGGNLRRLVELKRRYDPDNLFRVNHNIDPSWNVT